MDSERAAPARAAELEAADPVPSLRDEFCIPPWPGGAVTEWAYMAGNSLGLQPRAARSAVAEELDEWARLGVEGWFESREPWLEYAGSLRASIARLVGASPEEVAAMNTLTVNLHLLMATFYRPTAERFRILIEDTAFPSDLYAVQSQAAWHGLDPASAVVRVPIDGIEAAIEREGDSLALALLPGVNYLDGRVLDVSALTRAVHATGAVAGWDLAHAIGNVPVALHDGEADFAVWCHYKYVNAGPGAPGGSLRPRALRPAARPAAPRRLVGKRSCRPFSDGAGLRARGRAPRAGPSRHPRCSRSPRSTPRSSSSTASESRPCGPAPCE